MYNSLNALRNQFFNKTKGLKLHRGEPSAMSAFYLLFELSFWPPAYHFLLFGRHPLNSKFCASSKICKTCKSILKCSEMCTQFCVLASPLFQMLYLTLVIIHKFVALFELKKNKNSRGQCQLPCKIWRS